MTWYLYIVECSDGSLYTGITIDIDKRIKKHNDGKGAKSILGKRPVKLMYSEQFENRSEALKREKDIKSWKRDEKLKLISGH